MPQQTSTPEKQELPDGWSPEWQPDGTLRIGIRPTGNQAVGGAMLAFGVVWCVSVLTAVDLDRFGSALSGKASVWAAVIRVVEG